MEQVPVRAEGGRKCVPAFASAQVRDQCRREQDWLSESQNRLTGLGLYADGRNCDIAFA
jgi:hypothetical protein